MQALQSLEAKLPAAYHIEVGGNIEHSLKASLACTMIGGTAGRTVLILLCLPALYAIWLKVGKSEAQTTQQEISIHSPGIA